MTEAPHTGLPQDAEPASQEVLAALDRLRADWAAQYDREQGGA